MTAEAPADDREQEFLRFFFHQADYVAAVHAAGDLMWFEQGHPKREQMITELGLPDDVSDDELRRALFDRRYAE